MHIIKAGALNRHCKLLHAANKLQSVDRTLRSGQNLKALKLQTAISIDLFYCLISKRTIN